MIFQECMVISSVFIEVNGDSLPAISIVYRREMNEILRLIIRWFNQVFRCPCQGYRKYYFDNILAKNTVILFLFSKINNCKTFVSKINYCNNFTIYFTIIWLYITIIWLLKQFLPTKVPCYIGEIEWPPHAVLTTDATQFYWLTTQFVIAELFLQLNK